MTKTTKILRFFKSLNYWNLLLISLLVLLIFLIITVYLDLFNKNFINKTIQLFPAIIASIALAISISLYDKFGIKKNIYEKKIAIALELLEVLKTEFKFFAFIKKAYTHSEYHYLSLLPGNDYDLNFHKRTNYPVIFLYRADEELFGKLDKFIDSMYLKKSIATDLKIFREALLFETYSKYKIMNPDHIIIGFNIYDIHDNDTILYYHNNITLIDLRENAFEIVNEIKNWLESQTKIKGLLNL